MLKEYTHVRQIQGESKRRWFSDRYFDLIVWFGEQDEIVGFQLNVSSDGMMLDALPGM